jgi:hypothetical protein
MIIIICYILICYYAYMQGRAHGVLFSLKGSRAFPWNEHRMFVLERGSVFALPFFSTLITTEDSLILLLVSMLSFPFWHNGAYYITRHSIDTPSYGWFSQSKSSSAKNNFGPTLRTVMFIISLIIITTWILYGPHK